VNILEIEGLGIRFRTLRDEVHAVNGLDLRVEAGETVALVGESGCGKSATALAVLGLLPPTATVTAEKLSVAGKDVLRLAESELRRLRGGTAAIVFQDPMTSLNPVMTIGAQIKEVLAAHTELSGRAARDRVVELLDEVGIPSPRQRADEYPHQFSGGMRQRAVIAIAIACRPQLLIADEPTTALDVTIQAQILELIATLIEENQMALLLITHDLGVVAGTCRFTNVMYGGRIVERASTRELFHRPTHPYTRGLLDSIPALDGARKVHLRAVSGQPPVLLGAPVGCTFAPRCERRIEVCTHETPPLAEAARAHEAACWNPLEASS
jgi:oligopeptide/dipeptide ABC transporter ATP-binding protein